MTTLSASSLPLHTASSTSWNSPTSSSSSSSSSSSTSSSSSPTEVMISEEFVNQGNEVSVSDEKTKMSRCFLGWAIFACMDFFFFIPGGFLLAIIGYNLYNIAMLVSGSILIFIFLIVIPGFGVGLVIRKQVREANKTINMTRRVSSQVEAGEISPLALPTLLTPPIRFLPPAQYAPLNNSPPTDQLAPPTVNCVVSTSGNNFHDFSHNYSILVTEGISDYLSCNNNNINDVDNISCLTTSSDRSKSNFIRNMFASRSGERTGYVELP